MARGTQNITENWMRFLDSTCSTSLRFACLVVGQQIQKHSPKMVINIPLEFSQVHLGPEFVALKVLGPPPPATRTMSHPRSGHYKVKRPHNMIGPRPMAAATKCSARFLERLQKIRGFAMRKTHEHFVAEFGSGRSWACHFWARHL